MQTTMAKAEHLLAQVDWSRRELSEIRATKQSAEALVAHLERQPRPMYRVELARKADIVAFLSAHYPQWRAFDAREADRLVRELPANRHATRGVGELGIAWWATGDPKYGATFDRLFRENDTGAILPDHCFRSLAVESDLQAYLLLQDCPALTVEGRIAFFDHLMATCDSAFDVVLMKYRHLDIGPNGHNYWVNSAISLPVVGVLFPEFARSAFFLRTGDSVMDEHLRNNYHADGGSRETAFAYTAHEMKLLWMLMMLQERNGVPVSPHYRNRVDLCTRFLLKLMTPQGGFPKFGDMTHEPGGLALLAAVATAATGDGEFKWYAEYARQFLRSAAGETPGVLPYVAFWECGLAGARTYEQTQARAPASGSVLMAPTGIAALTDALAPRASYLAIIAAERGPFVTSHGHSDFFSVDVTAGGERFIGEPACKMYGYSEGRQYELNSASKSTVMVNGQTQIVMPAPFRFDGDVNPTVLRWISEPTHDFLHAVHEAYYHYQVSETLHERKVFFLKSGATAGSPGTTPGYWVMLDFIEAAQENDYTVSFQGLFPGELDGTTALLHAPGRAGFAIVPPAGDALAAALDNSPARQAFLREYAHDPTTHPCFTYRLRAADAVLVWVLTPLAAGQSAPRVQRMPVRINGIDAPPMAATAVEIDFGVCRDILCISHKEFDNQIDFGGESFWGNLAFRRFSPTGARLMAMDNRVRDGVCGR